MAELDVRALADRLFELDLCSRPATLDELEELDEDELRRLAYLAERLR